MISHIALAAAARTIEPYDVDVAQVDIPQPQTVLRRCRSVAERDAVVVSETDSLTAEPELTNVVEPVPGLRRHVGAMPDTVDDPRSTGGEQVLVSIAEIESFPPEEQSVGVQRHEFVHAATMRTGWEGRDDR